MLPFECPKLAEIGSYNKSERMFTLISAGMKLAFSYDKKLTAVNYNPYLFNYFFEKDSENPVYKASSVLICGKKIIITK
jgi:hypothetical protein